MGSRFSYPLPIDHPCLPTVFFCPFITPINYVTYSFGVCPSSSLHMSMTLQHFTFYTLKNVLFYFHSLHYSYSWGFSFSWVPCSHKSRDSSVGIALGYGLDDRVSRVRFLAGAGNFSLHHRVQNGSGAHPASYSMSTRGSFPGGKAAGG
jgi:hypothetical protein